MLLLETFGRPLARVLQTTCICRFRLFSELYVMINATVPVDAADAHACRQLGVEFAVQLTS